MISSDPLLVVAALVGLCLASCAVLFAGLRSTAVVKDPKYQLGGAVAAFFLLLPIVATIHDRLRPKEPDKLETAQIIPPGYTAVTIKDANLSLAIPKEYVPEAEMIMRVYRTKSGNKDQIAISVQRNTQVNDCNSPEKIQEMMHTLSKFFQTAFSNSILEDIRPAPTLGFNGAEAILRAGESMGSIVLTRMRLICDPKLAHLVFLGLPPDEIGAKVASTIVIIP